MRGAVRARAADALAVEPGHVAAAHARGRQSYRVTVDGAAPGAVHRGDEATPSRCGTWFPTTICRRLRDVFAPVGRGRRGLPFAGAVLDPLHRRPLSHGRPGNRSATAGRARASMSADMPDAGTTGSRVAQRRHRSGEVPYGPRSSIALGHAGHHATARGVRLVVGFPAPAAGLVAQRLTLGEQVGDVAGELAVVDLRLRATAAAVTAGRATRAHAPRRRSARTGRRERSRGRAARRGRRRSRNRALDHRAFSQ